MTPQATFVWDALNVRLPTMLRIVDALPEPATRWRPPGESNSVAWLLWHVAEVEDNFVRDRLLGLPKRYPLGTSVRAAPHDAYPTKPELLAYFYEVRALTRSRLEACADADFERELDDAHFGRLTARQCWALVATGAAWHGGQIALTARLIPPSLRGAVT